MLKEDCFLGCGQSLLCELKSQSHKHLAYAERLKLHHSFLKFGPAGPAACVTCAQTAKVSWFFSPGLLRSTCEGKYMPGTSCLMLLFQ